MYEDNVAFPAGSGDLPKPFTKPGSGLLSDLMPTGGVPRHNIICPSSEPMALTYTGRDRACFGCGKVMHEDYPQQPHNPLSANWLDATDWTSIGNWCSSKLDCCVDTNVKKAHIVICDTCFENRKDRIVKIRYTPEEKAKLHAEQEETLQAFKKLITDEANYGSEPKND